MSAASKDKWPTDFKITKVSESVLGQQLNLYLISSILTSDQAAQFSSDIDSITSHSLREGDNVFLSVLAAQEQIEKVSKIYQPRAKNWRGQYYALANAVVDSCGKFTK